MRSAPTCTSCGGALFSGDRFCGSCGAGVTVCTTCGEPLLPDDRFCPKCGIAVLSGPPSVSPWDRILDQLRSATLGEYEIKRELGRGGMAAVFLAHEIALNRLVAIKVMSPAVLMGEGMVDRFRQEAVTIANLNHPHIITIHGVRQAGDLNFFVMKFVEGRSLETLVQQAGVLPIPVVRSVLSQVGSALAYAHRRGVVHRDVKPANILVDTDGSAVVTDFGIAKVAESPSQTQTGTMVGTPAYMSPEQCHSGQVSWSSDQYSLGIVAYEMITGRAPFTGSTFAVMQGHTQTPPRPPRELRPDCPQDLEAAVLRMLAKAPADRWPTITEMLRGSGTNTGADSEEARAALAILATPSDADQVLDKSTTPLSPIPLVRSASSTRQSVAAPVVSIDVSAPPADIETGDRFPLKATVRGDSGIILADRRVSWASSDPAVAEVDPSRGTVAALTPGNATITAAAERIQGSVAIRVVAARAARIELSSPRDRLYVGEQFRLVATVRDRRGAEVDATVTWSTSDSEVGTVSSHGTVAGKRVGSVTIAAACGRVRGTVVLAVTSAPVAGIRLSVPPRSVEVGETFTLTAVALNPQDDPLDGRMIAWSSSDHAIATVASDGTVTARAPGPVTFTATCEGRSATASVTVIDVPVASVQLSEPPGPLSLGRKMRLEASVSDARGRPRVRMLDWRSNNAAVAVVSEDGVITPVGVGDATISVSAGGIEASVPITVASASTPKTEAPRRDHRLRWPSALRRWWWAVPTGAAVVLLVALAVSRWPRELEPPPTGVKPADPPPPAPVTSVTLAPALSTLTLGDSATISATAFGAAGETLTGRAVRWRSDNPAVASVDSSGVIVARGPGSARLSATIDGRTAAASITVVAKAEVVASVRIIPGDTTVATGGSVRLGAVVKGTSGATLAGRRLRWRSSDPGVAVIDPATGVVKAGTQTGRVTITVATEGRITATASLTVALPRVSAVTINPAKLALVVGETRDLQATAWDAGGALLPGRSPTWSSADPGIVRIDPSGRAVAIRQGVTTVRATIDGARATVPVTVKGPVVETARVVTVALAPRDTSLQTGGTMQLRVSLRDGSGKALDRPVAWESGNSAVAAVDPSGRVTARAVGEAWVRARSEERRDSVRVIVTAPPPPPPVTDPLPAIRGSVEQYGRAIEAASLADLNAVYPGMTADQQKRWGEVFDPRDGGKDWRADLRTERVSVDRDSAEIGISGTISFRDTRNRLIAARYNARGVLKRDSASGAWRFLRIYDEKWKQ